MISEFSEIFTFSITIRDVIGNLLIALLCGIIISLVYKFSYKGVNYAASFSVSLIMLTMITSVVIMVIGNNLARAFGMVGAMSIIRFRTAIKDTIDIMFIFFALAIGLACGVKLYAIAIFSTIFICLVFIAISKMNFSITRKKEFLLQVMAYTSLYNENQIEKHLLKYCSRYKLVNVKSSGEGQNNLIELSYHVVLKEENRGNEMVQLIQKEESCKNINLFFDDTY